MNFQLICLLMRCCWTSLSCLIFLISLEGVEADLNVFALSDITTEGSPLRPTKRRNASRNECAERVSVSSKCTARVDAKVNKQICALTLPYH